MRIVGEDDYIYVENYDGNGNKVGEDYSLAATIDSYFKRLRGNCMA